MAAPPAVYQAECGHSALCVGCAFRVFASVRMPTRARTGPIRPPTIRLTAPAPPPQERRCPLCRAPMLCPLMASREDSTGELTAHDAVCAANAALCELSKRGKAEDAAATASALALLFPKVPTASLGKWFQAANAACTAAESVQSSVAYAAAVLRHEPRRPEVAAWASNAVLRSVFMKEAPPGKAVM